MRWICADSSSHCDTTVPQCVTVWYKLPSSRSPPRSSANRHPSSERRQQRAGARPTSHEPTSCPASIVNRQSSTVNFSPPTARCSTRTTRIRIAGDLPIASTSRWRRACQWRSSRTWRGARRPAARWRRWCRTSRRAWAASRRSRRISSSACGPSSTRRWPRGRRPTGRSSPSTSTSRPTNRSTTRPCGRCLASTSAGSPRRPGSPTPRRWRRCRSGRCWC